MNSASSSALNIMVDFVEQHINPQRVRVTHEELKVTNLSHVGM